MGAAIRAPFVRQLLSPREARRHNEAGGARRPGNNESSTRRPGESTRRPGESTRRPGESTRRDNASEELQELQELQELNELRELQELQELQELRELQELSGRRTGLQELNELSGGRTGLQELSGGRTGLHTALVVVREETSGTSGTLGMCFIDFVCTLSRSTALSSAVRCQWTIERMAMY